MFIFVLTLEFLTLTKDTSQTKLNLKEFTDNNSPNKPVGYLYEYKNIENNKPNSLPLLISSDITDSRLGTLLSSGFMWNPKICSGMPSFFLRNNNIFVTYFFERKGLEVSGTFYVVDLNSYKTYVIDGNYIIYSNFIFDNDIIYFSDGNSNEYKSLVYDGNSFILKKVDAKKINEINQNKEDEKIKIKEDIFSNLNYGLIDLSIKDYYVRILFLSRNISRIHLQSRNNLGVHYILDYFNSNFYQKIRDTNHALEYNGIHIIDYNI